MTDKSPDCPCCGSICTTDPNRCYLELSDGRELKTDRHLCDACGCEWDQSKRSRYIPTLGSVADDDFHRAKAILEGMAASGKLSHDEATSIRIMVESAIPPTDKE